MRSAISPHALASVAAVVYDAHVASPRQLAQRLDAKLILDTHPGHSVQTEQPKLVINSTGYVVDGVRQVPEPAGLRFTPQPNPAWGWMGSWKPSWSHC